MDDRIPSVSPVLGCSGGPDFCPVIDVVPIPIVVLARKNETILSINRKAAELFGVEPDDVAGRPADALLDAGIRAALLDEIARIGSTSAHEHLLHRPSGTEFWALVTGSLTEHDDGIRTLLRTGPGAAQEVSRLLEQVKPTLPVLLANLTSLGQVFVTYNGSMEQLLVLFPPYVAGIQSVDRKSVV